MKYFTPNATKKGLLDGELKIETLDPDKNLDWDAQKAARRMAVICADPAEVALYKYDPNAARGNREPGIPDDDYNQLVD